MAEERVAKFLSRRQKKQSRIVWKHYDQRTLYDKYGLYELKTWAGNLPEIIKIGKPYAGEPHVRFDCLGLATPALASVELSPEHLDSVTAGTNAHFQLPECCVHTAFCL
jgi:hypothetical protein